MIIIARFISPVHIRKLMIIGGSTSDHHPSYLKCYVNQETFDFDSVDSVRPVQEFQLPINDTGNAELITLPHSFTNITSLTFYFNRNHGEVDVTNLQYIGMQGEHTHYRREAVHANYEVLCNGQDIPQDSGDEVSKDIGHELH